MSYNQKINFFMLVVFSLTPFLAPFFITPMTYESEYFIFSNAHSIQLQENEKSFIRLNHDEVSNYSDWKDDSEIYNIKHYKYSTVFRSYDGLTVSYDDVKSTISLLDIAINPYNNDVTTGDLVLLPSSMAFDYILSKQDSIIITESFARELLNINGGGILEDLIGLGISLSKLDEEQAREEKTFIIRGFYSEVVSESSLNSKYAKCFGEAFFVPRVEESHFSEFSYFISIGRSKDNNLYCYEDYVFLRTKSNLSIHDNQTDVTIKSLLADFERLNSVSSRIQNSAHIAPYLVPLTLIIISFVHLFIYSRVFRNSSTLIHLSGKIFMWIQVFSQIFMIFQNSYKVGQYSFSVYTRESLFVHLFATLILFIWLLKGGALLTNKNKSLEQV